MIICLIQTRIGSTRLPGKCMMNINNIPLTSYVIKAAQKSNLIDLVGIIYPDNDKDKKIFSNAYKDECFCFAGSENNVLNRYYNAVKYLHIYKNKNIEHIVRLTSDCPLLYYNPKIIDGVIKIHLQNKNNFTHNKGKNTFPSGLDVEIMDRKTLEIMHEMATSKEDKEHVTLYVKNNPNKFKIGEYEMNKNIKINKVSIDTKEEFEKVSDIINLYELGEIINGK